MKKFNLLAIFIVLAILISGCSIWDTITGTPTVSEIQEKEITGTFASFDEGMEEMYAIYKKLEDAKIELAISTLEEDDSDKIFAQMHEVDQLAAEMLAMTEYLSTTSDIFLNPTEIEEMDPTSLLIPAASAVTAIGPEDYGGISTGQQPYGIMRSIGNWCTNNQYRHQDEALRMGIYAGYKDIEKNWTQEDMDTNVTPIMQQLGIEKIEDIFYADLDTVEKFYTEVKQMESGFGQSFTWQKDDIYEALREGTEEDIYAYIDSVAATISDEIEEGQYGEYMPKHISDFMIRTIGYNAYVEYVERRRTTQLELQNQVNEETVEELNLYDFFHNYEEEHGTDDSGEPNEGGDYFDNNYEPEDNTEIIVAQNQETGEVIMGEVNTDEGNSINLPEGNYDVVATTDGNLPATVSEVPVTEGNITTVQNTTVRNPSVVTPGLLNLIVSLGQVQVTMPTQADLREAQNELALQEQILSALEHQLEILNSMEGGMFVTITPEARNLLNAQISETTAKIVQLEYDIFEMEGLIGETENETDEESKYPETFQAVGSWNGTFGDGGSINLSFPSAGGSVTGSFSGCGGGLCWSSTANGSFNGQEHGSVTGSISGYMPAGEYTPAFNISGSFSGDVYLDWGYAEGTFTTTLSGGGSSYGDSGDWYVTFD